MLNTIIIEDERPSRESLLQTLSRISADVNLLAAITSVQEGISYLGQPRNADRPTQSAPRALSRREAEP